MLSARLTQAVEPHGVPGRSEVTRARRQARARVPRPSAPRGLLVARLIPPATRRLFSNEPTQPAPISRELPACPRRRCCGKLPQQARNRTGSSSLLRQEGTHAWCRKWGPHRAVPVCSSPDRAVASVPILASTSCKTPAATTSGSAARQMLASRAPRASMAKAIRGVSHIRSAGCRSAGPWCDPLSMARRRDRQQPGTRRTVMTNFSVG